MEASARVLQIWSQRDARALGAKTCRPVREIV
jgi:hypothetical protein